MRASQIICFVGDQLLLVERDDPRPFEDQSIELRYVLPGDEFGGTVEQTAEALRVQTGYTSRNATLIGTMDYGVGEVYVYREGDSSLVKYAKEDEQDKSRKFVWMDWRQVLARMDVPEELKLIVPLARAKVENWTIVVDSSSDLTARYTVSFNECLG